jgi:hypothetical protein
MKVLKSPGLFICLFITSFAPTFAQELKCTVQLNSQKISGVDPSTFQTLQSAMTEFMNQRAWTTDVFAPEERIECSLYITLDGVVSAGPVFRHYHYTIGAPGVQ